MNMRAKLLIAATVLSSSLAVASASDIPIGSSLTFGGTNLPGACTDTSCSDTVTFSSTPVLIDGGALSLYETQTATGGGGEWDVWHLSTTNGGALAGDINGDWSLVMSYELSDAVDFDGVVDQWTVNGTPVSPLSNFSGICCAASSNPILPGEAYYNYGFSAPLSAGTQSDWRQIFVDPYSFVSAGGVDPSSANGFNFALHFTPQSMSSVPEPSPLILLGGGLGALACVFLRRRCRAARA